MINRPMYRPRLWFRLRRLFSDEPSNYDWVTQVGSLRSMYTLFDQCLTEAPDTQFIFCCVDLNNFRSVNNTYGPEPFGNKVLREVAQRLAKFGATFRMGGNRFGILLPVTAEQGQDYPFAIRKTIEDLRWADAPSLRLSCRVGSAHYPTECRTLDDIIRLSDDRLYAEWLERKHPNKSTA